MAMSKSVAGPDEDRTRFLRLCLVVIDELTPILQDLLHHEIHPNNIFNEATQKGLKTLNAHQRHVIGNAKTQGYKNFDISLLYTLLRNLCPNIPSPTQSWGVSKMPLDNEITIGDDIERIRLIRNNILGHISEAAIPEKEFKIYWSIISDICTRMQTKLNKDYVRMLQVSKDCTMDSDTESKYMEVIKGLTEEEKTNKDLLQKVLAEKGFTSNENLKIEAKDGNKRTFVETLTDVGIDTLNEMVNVINKMTSESEIDQLYESIEEFLKENKEEIENMDLQMFFKELKEKITSYAIRQTANSLRILAKFSKFIVRLRKEYRAYVECSRGSLILLMTFSSRKDYDRYKKDLENGEIGKQILQLFLYPPFLACFGLKKEDLVVYLNDRLLTQETALHDTERTNNDEENLECKRMTLLSDSDLKAQDAVQQIQLNVSSSFIAIAAIDFGTTFSGYAFGTIDNLQKNLTKTFVSFWYTGGLVSSRTPTTVLLDNGGNLVDFGFDAENHYAELLEEGEHEDYYYFRRFKMMLYENIRKSKLTTETKISDIRGRELKALTVFSHAIRYLKDHLLNKLEPSWSYVEKRNILWVLTVPAIWDDPAKSFMRHAAQMAGIPDHQLMIALEPEAASIYCKHLPVEELEGSNSISAFEPGSKYLVLDAGGGTIDITVHEVQENEHIKELNCASGGNWGGTSVDMTFKQALADIVTEEMMEGYCHKYLRDYIYLLRDFETKKRNCGVKNDSSRKITLNVPLTFIEECSETLGEDLTTLTSRSRFNNHFVWKSGKVRIDMPTFEGFFQPACNEIINHVKELFKSPRVKGLKKILMVGGFSESHLLQDAIRKAFPDCQVIVPQDAGLAVVRGAVIFGCVPNVTNSRIARYTYGVRMNEEFDPKKHLESKKKVINGVEYSKDIFDRHVRRGDVLIDDEAQAKRFYVPLTPQQSQISFNIYISEEEDPLYVDSCSKIGKVIVAVPEGNEKDRSVTVWMIFSETMLTARATVMKTAAACHVAIDLLEDEKRYR